MGLRSFPRGEFSGPYAYTTDSHLSSLDIPESLGVGVMVDAKTALGQTDPARAIQQLFRPATESGVGLVRVAARLGQSWRNHLGFHLLKPPLKI